MSTIISVYHPQQLLPALTALYYYRERYGIKRHAPAILVYWQQNGEQPGQFLHEALKNESWLKIHTINKRTHPKLTAIKTPIIWRARHFRKLMPQLACHQIFYPHDAADDYSGQVIMHAFPRAKRICFGDRFGVVYSNPHFDIRQLRHRIAHIALTRKRANLAMLMLPCELDGGALGHTPYLIPPRKVTLTVLANIISSLKSYQDYQQQLLAQTNDSRYLLVLSNKSGSGVMDEGNELKYYQDIMAGYIPADADLIIKPHASGNYQVIEKLVSSRIGSGKVIVIDDAFSHIPLDYAFLLVQQCKMISISFASIAIPYLYERPVIHAQSESLIRRYTRPSKVKREMHRFALYNSLLKQIGEWDGVSLLKPTLS